MSKKPSPTQRALILKGAALTLQMEALKAEIDLIKEKLAPLGTGCFDVPAEDGTLAQYACQVVESVVLDTAKVKGFLTPAELAEASVPRTSTRRAFKTRAAVAKAA